MHIIRHPKLAADIREASVHYAGISARVLSSFWGELEAIVTSIEKNPRSHHYDTCGLRRANMKRFPYHILYEVEDNAVLMVVFRHDMRHPSYGTRREM